MKKTRLISSVAVMFLLSFALTGCSENKNTSSAATTSSVEASNTNNTPATENGSVSTAQTNAGTADQTNAGTAANTISLEDAKKIAFDNAGVTEADIVLKKSEQSYDDGKQEYEIDFYYNDMKYDYDIDAANGSITSVSKETMDAEDRAEMEAIKNGANSTANSETTGAMDENKAFEIALKHANVAANDVGEKSVKKDFDDDYNKEIYEVNFKVGNMEYDYDIAVDTGEILKAESEIDD